MKNLFLDLEKTIIYSWDDPVIINESLIKNQIRTIQPDLIGIYSYAIYTSEDKEQFLTHSKEEIEFVLNIKIETSLILTVEEIARTILNLPNPDIKNFIQAHGKQKSFQDYIAIKHPEGEFILIDDLVQNELVSKGNLKIQFINPF